MNKLLVLSITAIFVLLCLQSCSKDDENQDEFLKEYNLPKGVTKPTIGWQYEEEVAKNALIAGFLNGDMWFAAYNEKKEQIFEYTAPMIRGFNQKFYLEFGKVEEHNIDHISLFNFIIKDDGIMVVLMKLFPLLVEKRKGFITIDMTIQYSILKIGMVIILSH